MRKKIGLSIGLFVVLAFGLNACSHSNRPEPTQSPASTPSRNEDSSLQIPGVSTDTTPSETCDDDGPIGEALQIATAGSEGCAIYGHDRKLKCWDLFHGKEASDFPRLLSSDGHVQSLAGDGSAFCATSGAERRLKCWKHGSEFTVLPLPPQIGDQSVEKVVIRESAAGGFTSFCAVYGQDHRALCWRTDLGLSPKSHTFETPSLVADETMINLAIDGRGEIVCGIYGTERRTQCWDIANESHALKVPAELVSGNIHQIEALSFSTFCAIYGDDHKIGCWYAGADDRVNVPEGFKEGGVTKLVCEVASYSYCVIAGQDGKLTTSFDGYNTRKGKPYFSDLIHDEPILQTSGGCAIYGNDRRIKCVKGENRYERIPDIAFGACTGQTKPHYFELSCKAQKANGEIVDRVFSKVRQTGVTVSQMTSVADNHAEMIVEPMPSDWSWESWFFGPTGRFRTVDTVSQTFNRVQFPKVWPLKLQDHPAMTLRLFQKTVNYKCLNCDDETRDVQYHVGDKINESREYAGLVDCNFKELPLSDFEDTWFHGRN